MALVPTLSSEWVYRGPSDTRSSQARIERLPSEHEDVCRVVGKDQENVMGKSTEMRRRTGLAARKKFDTGLGLVFGNGEAIGRQAR